LRAYRPEIKSTTTRMILASQPMAGETARVKEEIRWTGFGMPCYLLGQNGRACGNQALLLYQYLRCAIR
jgi:hypothetical protein